MKWINANERLPVQGKEVIWKWGNISGIFIEYTDWCADSNGIYIRTENLINILDEDNIYYWLDEEPYGESNLEAAKLYVKSKQNIDWNLLEKQFNEDFNTLTDKPTTGYDVVQWIKKKLRATN